MTKNAPIKQPDFARKAYQKPHLKPLGSVQQLTLKLGSLTDGQTPGSFQ